MNDFRADLHCHTTCSDGSETPEQVIQLAKQSGLSALSITDHDTIEAYKTAIPLAIEANIQLLTGVEFSTSLNEESVHILGYGFKVDHPAMTQLCLRHVERRKHRNLAVLERLTQHGLPLTYEEVVEAASSASHSKKGSIGRPHIAFAMIKKGYVNNLQEAFKKYIGEGCCCYVPGAFFTVDETIDTIHEAKGIAVIAHPHLIKNTALLNALLKKDFDGMECYYGRFLSSAHNRWLKIARHRNWLVTGGSDFHGEAKPNLNLGCSWIGAEPFQAILNYLSNHA
jgi:3',5'-nucleoside bisphosphate phosphatase